MSDDLNSLIKYDSLTIPDSLQLYSETVPALKSNLQIDTEFDNPEKINNDLVNLDKEPLLGSKGNESDKTFNTDSESESEKGELSDSENSENNVKTSRTRKVRFNLKKLILTKNEIFTPGGSNTGCPDRNLTL